MPSVLQGMQGGGVDVASITSYVLQLSWNMLILVIAHRTFTIFEQGLRFKRVSDRERQGLFAVTARGELELRGVC